MDNRQIRTFDTFRRVLLYLDANPLQSPPPLFGRMRTALAASIQRIDALGTMQGAAKREILGRVDERVRDLRRHRMMPLVRIAKPLLAYAPGVEKALAVPHARSDAASVASAALTMIRTLEPHARLLASAGCSKEFMRAFRDEARDLAAVAKNASAARNRQASATAKLTEEFKKGMKALTVLEGLILLHAGRDGVKVHTWKKVRRVLARQGRPRKRSRAQLENVQHMAR